MNLPHDQFGFMEEMFSAAARNSKVEVEVYAHRYPGRKNTLEISSKVYILNTYYSMIHTSRNIEILNTFMYCILLCYISTQKPFAYVHYLEKEILLILGLTGRV